MSKATQADSTSATTDAPSVDEARTPHASSQAVTSEPTDYTSPLYGTDRAAARSVITASHVFRHTEIDNVVVKRHGADLTVELSGNIALSVRAVKKYLHDGYVFDNMISHSSGNVKVMLQHESDV